MRTLIIDNHTRLRQDLEGLIPGDVTIRLRENYQPGEELEYDLVVLSGSNNGFPVQGHLEDLAPEVDLVLETTVPVIGICYGAQVIAAAYGGELDQLAEMHIGQAEVRVVADFWDSRKSFPVYEYHGWRVKNLPAEFEIIGRSDHAIEIFKHKEKYLWGLQFHPEHLRDVMLGDEIFQKIIHSIGLIQ